MKLPGIMTVQMLCSLVLLATPQESGKAKAVKQDPPATGKAVVKEEDGAQVFQGDAKVVPRLLRRSEGSFEVVYDSRLAMPLWTQERFQTTVTLPRGEEILRANAADDDNWEVLYLKGGNQFYVKPFFPNASTSINVITKARNRYVFRATSGVANKKHEPMLILDVLPPAWMKAEMEKTEAGSRRESRQGGGPMAVDGEVASTEGGDDISAAEVQKIRQEALEAGRKAGWEQAMARRDDELREYAASIFRQANLDYKWSGDTKEFRLKRVFDDGRVTYLVFDSALNLQPAFWEIEGGSRKDVTVQRAVFSPEILIVGKLFKEGTVSVRKDLEIKIKNRGYVLPSVKGQDQVQMRGEGAVASGGGAR